MSETYFTPEPRTLKLFDDAQIVVLGPKTSDGKQELIATFTGNSKLKNAMLDVAAPDLLAACERLRRLYRTGNPITIGDVQLLDSAIAKATGEAVPA